MLLEAWLRRFRRFRLDKAIRNGALSPSASLVRLTPYHMRYIEDDRCVDVYVEQCGDELILDKGSIRCWHAGKYDTVTEAASSAQQARELDDSEKVRVGSTVESSLQLLEPRSRIVVVDSRSRNGAS